MPLLEGLDGKEKMSKSLGNYIGVNEAPEVMFKKVMEIPDELIIKYFELATDEHPQQIAAIKARLENGENPRDIKIELAQIITALYHGEKTMKEARQYFETVFRKRELPNDIPTIQLEDAQETITDVIPNLIEHGLVTSKSEFLRLVKQNGVSLNGEKLTSETLNQTIASEDVIQIGKKRFVKVIK